MKLFTITFETRGRRKLDRVAWWFVDAEQAKRFGNGIVFNEGLLGLVGEEYAPHYASRKNTKIVSVVEGVTDDDVRAPNGELFTNAIYVPEPGDMPF